MSKNDTLCWRCSKACGRCSWSDGTFTPVKNWDAKPDKIRYKRENRFIQSYKVKSCPEFEEDVFVKTKISNAELAKKLGISKRTLYRKSYNEIEKLKEKVNKEML